MKSTRWSGSNRFRRFIGTRVRFQRMSDCRLFHGWVQELDNDMLVVRTSPDVAVMDGDSFRFEINGPDQVLMFTGQLVGGSHLELMRMSVNQSIREVRNKILSAGDLEFEFLITTAIATRSAQEEPRFAVQSAQGQFTYEGGSAEVILLDASLGGLGLRTDQNIPKGTVGLVRIETPHGAVTLKAIVQYCRSEGGGGAHDTFRLGMKIEEIDRLGQARWNQMMA